MTLIDIAVPAVRVALSVAIVAPVQWWSLGTRTVLLILVEGLVGWLLLEWLMRNWRQVPFTCTYLPRRGFVAAALTLRTLAALLSIRRRRHAGSAPLMFEDELPSDIIPFRLNGD